MVYVERVRMSARFMHPLHHLAGLEMSCRRCWIPEANDKPRNAHTVWAGEQAFEGSNLHNLPCRKPPTQGLTVD